MEATITTTPRGAQAEWEVSTYYDDSERGEVTQLAVLTVTYYSHRDTRLCSPACYAVRLAPGEKIDRGDYTRKRTVGVGRGGGFGVWLDQRDASKRFSAKFAAQLLDEWVGKVETLRDAGNESIAALFAPDKKAVTA